MYLNVELKQFRYNYFFFLVEIYVTNKHMLIETYMHGHTIKV
jgi:hypothetical protein